MPAIPAVEPEPDPEEAAEPDLLDVELAEAGAARIAVPVGWVVDAGPPLVAQPAAWTATPPGLVVTWAREDTDRDATALAAAVAEQAGAALADALVVEVVATDDDVTVVVAHRHRGVDVTTVERHLPRPGGSRWITSFTCADPDLPELLPTALRVVASLAVGDRDQP